MQAHENPQALLDRLHDRLRLFRSPADGTALALDRSVPVLTDGTGRRFPIVQGVPVLIPDIEKMLRSHYAVSRASGPPPAALDAPVASVAAAVAAGPVTGYALGFPILLTAVDDPRPGLPAGLSAGALYEDGTLRLACRDGSLAVRELKVRSPHFSIDGWEAIRAMLKLEPPFALVAEPFPDVVLSTYFELVLFAGADLIHRLLNRREAMEAPGAPDLEGDVLGRQNVPFMRWLFTAYALPVDRAPVLDIGCGSGFLSRAAMGAGARSVLATDLRFPGQMAHASVETDPLLFAMADMFQWSYGERAFALVNFRNNSAHAKSPEIDARFDRLHASAVASLVDGGLGYLTVVTSGNGELSGDGLMNVPPRAVLDSFKRAGVAVVKLMRLGSCLGVLFGRPKDVELARRTRVAARLQRKRAIDDVLVAGATSPGALRALFLACCDVVSEVALAAHARGTSDVVVWGAGLLSYYVWRLITVNFPELTVRTFVVPQVVRQPGDALQMQTPADALRAYPGPAVCVVTDSALPVPPSAWTVVPFVPFDEPRAGVDDALVAAVADPAWSFHYMSGDQDESLPGPICLAYLKGPLEALGGGTPDPAFAAKFRTAFPSGFTGV